MDIVEIINTIHDKLYNDNLVPALSIIMNHIQYCKKHNIDMSHDPLLSKVIYFG